MSQAGARGHDQKQCQQHPRGTPILFWEQTLVKTAARQCGKNERKPYRDHLSRITEFNELRIKDTAAQDVPNSSIQMDSIDTEQVVMMLGQPTIPHGHPDALGLRLLQCHLGDRPAPAGNLLAALPVAPQAVQNIYGHPQPCDCSFRVEPNVPGGMQWFTYP